MDNATYKDFKTSIKQGETETESGKVFREGGCWDREESHRK
ncbi:unnamed protein product, partial [Brassica rapa subsp. trilocularis]